jgi:hypothetical protein
MHNVISRVVNNPVHMIQFTNGEILLVCLPFIERTNGPVKMKV